MVGGRVLDPDHVDRLTFDERQIPAEEAEEVCERLLALPPELLPAVPMSEVVREAVEQAQEVRTHGARRRQRLYVAKLLRAEDLEAITEALDGELIDPLEEWRDRLVAERNDAVEAFLAEHPGAERQRLRQAVRLVRKSPEGSSKQGRALEALLQVLREST